MGHIKLKANEHGYKEKHKRLKEQLINGISNEEMMTEKIRKLHAIKETNEAKSEQVLHWPKGVEKQPILKALPEATKEITESEEFYMLMAGFSFC